MRESDLAFVEKMKKRLTVLMQGLTVSNFGVTHSTAFHLE